jgi:LmbE family N-acetylglucosaminyl deacetylase
LLRGTSVAVWELEEVNVLQVLLMLFFALAALVPSNSRAETLHAIEPLISHATRLIVFAPHPDDESLGAGGLIQRVLKAGGKVKVVFITCGDGFPEGVERANHISHPTAKDYRRYGVERREEALKATATLGMKEHDVIFLTYPDGGLSYLRFKFRAHPFAYTSPFTRENRPPISECILPHCDYTGRDLTREIERVIAEFRPNLAATTPDDDWHPDHSATHFFVKEALRHLNGKHPNLKPHLLTFLIHFEQWPISQSSGAGARLNPPDDFPDQGREWISFPLKPEEMEIKRKAILEYHTQMLVMGRYLMSFARSNELYMPDD